MTETRSVRTFERPVVAEVPVPGSKSIANRALVCAALAAGVSELTNLPDGDDTVSMVDCLHELGLDADLDAGRVSIDGVDGRLPTTSAVLHAGLAGTTSRFVTALAALAGGDITIDGHPPLRARPFGPLHDALTQLGVSVTCHDTPGGLPATVVGPPSSGDVTIRGDVSSQYVTALMLIGPYLPGGLRLQLTTPLISLPYVELTAAVMSDFGHDQVDIDDDAIAVATGRYRASTLAIEPDASSASYPLAVAAVCGGRVTVPGLGVGARQGDARFADLLDQIGCTVTRTNESVTVEHDASRPLVGIDVDMADISDLVPTLAVVAAFASTTTRIRGVGFIRAKESDRLGDLSRELRAAGVRATETADGVEIEPSVASARPARLGTHHDHRLAMAFGVLGSAVPGIEVEEPAVVSKSWPGYWDALDAMAQ